MAYKHFMYYILLQLSYMRKHFIKAKSPKVEKLAYAWQEAGVGVLKENWSISFNDFFWIQTQKKLHMKITNSYIDFEGQAMNGRTNRNKKSFAGNQGR